VLTHALQLLIKRIAHVFLVHPLVLIVHRLLTALTAVMDISFIKEHVYLLVLMKL
jgi:hypothetical protein